MKCVVDNPDKWTVVAIAAYVTIFNAQDVTVAVILNSRIILVMGLSSFKTQKFSCMLPQDVLCRLKLGASER